MAEMMLEFIGAGVAKRVGDKDWKDIWFESEECRIVEREIKAIKERGLSIPVQEKGQLSMCMSILFPYDRANCVDATPFWYQLKTVVQRNNVALWRSPDYVFSRLFVHAFISLFVSLPLLNLGHTSRELQYRAFGIFWVGVLPAIIMAQLQPMFIFNRRTFIREASSRIYSPFVFAIAQLLGEFPYSILCAIIYWLLMVFPMGFGKGSAGTGGLFFQLCMVIGMEFFGVTLGQLLASISPSIQVAVLFK